MALERIATNSPCIPIGKGTDSVKLGADVIWTGHHAHRALLGGGIA